MAKPSVIGAAHGCRGTRPPGRNSVRSGIGVLPISSGNPELIVHRTVGPRPYIRTHNAIRGFAAVGVFGYHLQLEGAYRIPLGFAAPLITRGYVWVDLFFILSGFVMSLTYRDALGRPGSAVIRAFLFARIARIVPLHLVALGYLALLVFGFSALSWAVGREPYWGPLTRNDLVDLGLQASLVQIWDASAVLSWNIPSWSISAEMHVYLLLPPLALALRYAPRAASIALGIAAAAIYAMILLQYRSLDILSPVSLLRCFAGFVLGVLIEEYRTHLAGWPARVLTLMQCAAIAAIVMLLLSPVHDVWLIMPFAALVALTASDQGLLSRMLAGNWQQRLGDTSYSIYLLNFPVLITAGLIWSKIRTMFAPLDSEMTRIAWMALLLLLLLILSRLTYRHVERPLRELTFAALQGTDRAPRSDHDGG